MIFVFLGGCIVGACFAFGVVGLIVMTGGEDGD